ncbi:MAG: choice-of-anchor D domain-containing protein [Deltaproteobacteria bacterium]|nr:choice-of-anchor D domain-containing protein [Deltaproteobacteria bacterium]
MRAIARLALALPLVLVGLADCNCDEVVAGTAPQVGILDDLGNLHTEADPWLAVPFGDVDTGQTSTKVLQVKNVGFGRLHIASVCVVNAPDLAAAVDPATPCLQQAASPFVFPSIVGQQLRADAVVDLPVSYKPTAGGPTSAFLRVGSDAVAEPLAAVQLIGRGTDGTLCADPVVVDFGDVTVGTSKTLPVVVGNCGVKPVIIDALLLAANPEGVFAFDVAGAAPPLPIGPLAEGESVTLNVTFTPARAVAYRDANAGDLRVTTAAPFAATYDLILLGNGIEPPSCRVNVVPSTVSFGAVASGAAADRQVIVQSVGQCACTVTAITDPSPADVGFALPNPAALPVVLRGTSGCDTDPSAASSAPQSLTIPVRYTSPQRQNPVADRATMTVTTDAPVDPTRTIALEANGGGTPFCQLRVTPEGTGSLLPSPPNKRWGIVQFGRTSVYLEKKLPIRLENVGNAPCTVSQVAYDKQENTLFNEFRLETEAGGNAITNASATVQPGAALTFFAVFAPTHTIQSDNPLDIFSFGSYSGSLGGLGCGGLFGTDPNTRCNGVKFVTSDTTTDVSASEQPAGTFSVGFSGTPVEPSVDVIPPELDFGLVTLDCGSPERRTTLYNTGATALVVGQPYVDPATTPPTFGVVSTSNPGDSPTNTTSGWPYTVQPGNSLSVSVRYFARAEGLQTGLLVVPTVLEDDSEGPPVTVPLQGEGTLISTQTDVFDQAGQATVDVLFVVDDSGSMSDDQAQLAGNFPQFFTASNVDDADYHIAVTTTLTVGSGCIPTPGSPSCPDDDMSGYYTSCSNDRFLTRSSSDPQGQFACNVRVSDNRNPDRSASDSGEGGLRAAYNFLSAPKIDDPAINGGFLRDNAKLHVIIVTDEPDQSRGPTDLYVDFFRNLKGFRNESLVAVSAIAKRDGQTCNRDDADVGDERYEAVVDALNGRFQSLCDQDWSGSMRALGLDSIGLQVEFFLSRAATESSLSVCVRSGSSTAACQPVAATTDGAPNGWFYDPAANSVVFNPGSVPPRGSRVEVRYDAFCFQP